MKYFGILRIKTNSSRILTLAVILICLTQLHCSIHDYAVLPSIQAFTVAGESEAWLVTQRGKVLHFSDGGQNVKEVKFSAKIVQIFFLNAREGWALDEKGQIWATVNNGKDWEKRALFAEGNPADSSNSLFFIDNQVGWLKGIFSIWMTENGGASWSMVFPTEQFSYSTLDGQPMSISAANSDAAWVGFSSGAVLRTTNRGKNWEQTKKPGKYDLEAIHGFSADECIVSGRNGGGLFHTTDGGKSWKQVMNNDIRSYVGIDSLSFVDKKVGWAAGLTFVTDINNPERDIDLLLKTTDGGKTWKQVDTSIKETQGFGIVKFANEKTGWLLGERTIYHTSDGGNSWVELLKVEDYNQRNK